MQRDAPAWTASFARGVARGKAGAGGEGNELFNNPLPSGRPLGVDPASMACALVVRAKKVEHGRHVQNNAVRDWRSRRDNFGDTMRACGRARLSW